MGGRGTAPCHSATGLAVRDSQAGLSGARTSSHAPGSNRFPRGWPRLRLTDGLVYLALQELATRILTGQHWASPGRSDIEARKAADENLHFLFYRELATSALRVGQPIVNG